jgi:hypothetical protein
MKQTDKIKGLIVIMAIVSIIVIASLSLNNKLKENAKKKTTPKVIALGDTGTTVKDNEYLTYQIEYSDGVNTELTGTLILEVDNNGNLTGNKIFVGEKGDIMAKPPTYKIVYPVTKPAPPAAAAAFFTLPDNGDPLADAYVRVNPETNELEYDILEDAFDVTI